MNDKGARVKIFEKIAILALSIGLGWSGWKGLNALLMAAPEAAPNAGQGAQAMDPKVKKTDAEWKKELSPDAYQVMFQCGTEPPWSGKYNDFWEKGVYACSACGSPLFSSETKYEHGSGWPSFAAALERKAIVTLEDSSHGMNRTEVRCASCGAHLGHVFSDGPGPTGEHYCINSVALTFKPGETRAAADSGTKVETATFAAGCFWGIEDKFGKLPGVVETAVGYSGGKTENPSYKQVCSDKTGHAESVRVTFDPAQTSYEDLVRAFFDFHDPTQLNRQGPDVGTQYRSVIFYHDEEQKTTAEKVRAELETKGRFTKKIVTDIVPEADFYRAEEYHQKYYDKNKRGACAF
jgi:peptide methionine sulfoxide reductase msrA/msrB